MPDFNDIAEYLTKTFFYSSTIFAGYCTLSSIYSSNVNFGSFYNYDDVFDLYISYNNIHIYSTIVDLDEYLLFWKKYGCSMDCNINPFLYYKGFVFNHDTRNRLLSAFQNSEYRSTVWQEVMWVITKACENGGYIDIYVNHLGGNRFDFRDQYNLRRNFSIHNYNQFSLHIHNAYAYIDWGTRTPYFGPRFDNATWCHGVRRSKDIFVYYSKHSDMYWIMDF
jgi:hypothetical protein